MLSKPKHGWCDITIGDFTDRASYLTLVHLDILKAICKLCQTHKPQTVFINAEGWEYYIVFDCYSTLVILCKEEKPETFEHIIHYKEIAKEVVKDIRDNFDDWMHWKFESHYEELILWLDNLENEMRD